jgi:uncharacterized membrane protein YcaP (DUF421 family)
MDEALNAVFRSAITFTSLLIFSRILGKTQIGQLTFFEYITGITIGSIAGRLASDLNGRPWPVYVSMLTYIGLALVTEYLVLNNRWLAKLVDGEPVVVVQNGQVLEGRLRQSRLDLSELMSMARAQGAFDLSKVEFAVLEPNGALSVLQRSQHRPVTPADLQVPTKYEGLGTEVIVEGQISMQNLRSLGLNQAWLVERLQEHGVDSPAEVFLAVLDAQGRLYVDRYRDQTPRANDISDYPGPN